MKTSFQLWNLNYFEHNAGVRNSGLENKGPNSLGWWCVGVTPQKRLISGFWKQGCPKLWSLLVCERKATTPPPPPRAACVLNVSPLFLFIKWLLNVYTWAIILCQVGIFKRWKDFWCKQPFSNSQEKISLYLQVLAQLAFAGVCLKGPLVSKLYSMIE